MLGYGLEHLSAQDLVLHPDKLEEPADPLELSTSEDSSPGAPVRFGLDVLELGFVLSLLAHIHPLHGVPISFRRSEGLRTTISTLELPRSRVAVVEHR